MAPKKSKVKKPKVKRSVTQPAKSIIERSICSHPMLKRVQKEVSNSFNVFSTRLKYQKNMAPKKSKVKKPKVKRSVTQPAKSIIERTICSHPMLKRVQKEVRELKKKSVKKYKK
ncbi:unnamed protein product [Bathycoccus prasinos]